LYEQVAKQITHWIDTNADRLPEIIETRDARTSRW